jgi:hypothetical protein
LADHTIEVNFKDTSSCSNADQARDLWIIQRMALSICAPGTTVETLPAGAMNEAIRTYLMINAMRLALEEEVRANSKFEQFN